MSRIVSTRCISPQASLTYKIVVAYWNEGASQRNQVASSTQFPTFLSQDQQPSANSQRNISAPVSSTPLIPSATHEMPQASLPRSPAPYPLYRMDAAGSRPVDQALRSAPLPSLNGTTHYSDPTDRGLAIPRHGYPDFFVPIPPQGMAGGPASYHRVSDGRRLPLSSANTVRNPTRSRGPVYVGPSNDARVLEKEDVPRHRHSFGEGRVGRENAHTLGQQKPFSKPFPPFQQSGPYAAPPRFAHQGSENMSVELIDSAKRAMSSDNGYVAAAYAQGSYRKHPNMSIRTPLDRLSAPYEDGRANPAQHFTTPPRRGRDTFPGSSDAERHGYQGNIPSHHVHNTFDALPLYSPTRHRYSNASSRPPRVNPRAENSEEQHTSASSHTHRWDRNDAFCDRKIWIGGLKPDANIKVLADLLQQWGPFNVSKIKVSKQMLERETQFNGYAFAESVPFHDPGWFALILAVLPCLKTPRMQSRHSTGDM